MQNFVWRNIITDSTLSSGGPIFGAATMILQREMSCGYARCTRRNLGVMLHKAGGRGTSQRKKLLSQLSMALVVQKAIAFARKAHHGQLRKMGDPYLTHCIHTGRIIAVLVPSTG